MHTPRDKRSHTDQQTERFCCSTLMRTAVYLRIQPVDVAEFPLTSHQCRIPHFLLMNAAVIYSTAPFHGRHFSGGPSKVCWRSQKVFKLSQNVRF